HGMRGFFEYGRFSSAGGTSSRQLGVRFMSLTPYRPTFDIALAGWRDNALVVVPDVDLALPLPLASSLRIVPRAGVSLLFASWGGPSCPAAGANVGMGLVFDLNPARSLRADAVARQYAGEELADDNPVVSFTVGLGWRTATSTPSITSEP